MNPLYDMILALRESRTIDYADVLERCRHPDHQQWCDDIRTQYPKDWAYLLLCSLMHPQRKASFFNTWIKYPMSKECRESMVSIFNKEMFMKCSLLIRMYREWISQGVVDESFFFHLPEHERLVIYEGCMLFLSNLLNECDDEHLFLSWEEQSQEVVFYGFLLLHYDKVQKPYRLRQYQNIENADHVKHILRLMHEQVPTLLKDIIQKNRLQNRPHSPWVFRVLHLLGGAAPEEEPMWLELYQWTGRLDGCCPPVSVVEEDIYIN